jgi:DNA-binding transcriptional LysR family regulator
MRSTWLEDFLSLAHTRNFSRSAQERNVTQPAFSRRIQALETWLGVELLDRNSYPPTLTPAGMAFRDIARQLLTRIQDARDVLRGQSSPETIVHFAAPHALVPRLLSGWIMDICAEAGPMLPRITAANALDALALLGEDQGSYDFVVAYHHVAASLRLPDAQFPHLVLGRERVLPVVAADAFGEPRFRLPGDAAKPIPFFGYTPGLFMGKIVEIICAKAERRACLAKCYETDLVDAVRSMIVAGRGMAWLPESLVADELAAASLALAGGAEWHEWIEIRLYYAVRKKRPLPARLWEFLREHPRPLAASAMRER